MSEEVVLIFPEWFNWTNVQQSIHLRCDLYIYIYIYIYIGSELEVFPLELKKRKRFKITIVIHDHIFTATSPGTKHWTEARDMKRKCWIASSTHIGYMCIHLTFEPEKWCALYTSEDIVRCESFGQHSVCPVSFLRAFSIYQCYDRLSLQHIAGSYILINDEDRF